MDGLDRNIAEFDQKINRGLETDLDKSGLFGNPAARLQRPHLQSSAYQRLEFKGFDDAGDGVVASIVQLYYAGYRTLPAAAEQYGIAAMVLPRRAGTAPAAFRRSGVQTTDFRGDHVHGHGGRSLEVHGSFDLS